LATVKPNGMADSTLNLFGANRVVKTCAAIYHFYRAQIMKFVCETTWSRRVLVTSLCVSLLSATCGIRRPAAGAPMEGARTSDEAARSPDTGSQASALAAWLPTADFLASSAVNDTTEVDFPLDAEEEGKHLYRDIGIFLVVSAFVGYFIVKAFLQGDTEEEPPPKKGKDIPSS
jgi:hypothetical protein